MIVLSGLKIGKEGTTMRRKKERSSQCADWMNTYADMVTLLLTFFVLLFAMSNMSTERWKKIANAINARAGNSPISSGASVNPQTINGTRFSSPLTSVSPEVNQSSSGLPVDKVRNFDDLYPYFKNYLAKSGRGDEVALYRGDGYTFFSFRSTVFFSGDSSNLQPGGKQVLDVLCNAISGIPDQIGEIRFYGHTAKISATDTPARQAFDRGLSDDRAKNVLLYVQSKNIIGGDKMVSEGFGEYWPIAKDDGTEATRARNRRVEIYISKTGNAGDILPQIYNSMGLTGSSPSSQAGPAVSVPPEQSNSGQADSAGK